MKTSKRLQKQTPYRFLSIFFLFVFSLTSYYLSSQEKIVFESEFDKPTALLKIEKLMDSKAYLTNNGYIISSNKDVAYFMAKEWDKATKNFENHFQTKIPKGIVFDIQNVNVEILSSLSQIGISWNLPWPATMIYESEKSQGKISQISDEHSENNALGHELGHRFLMAAFNWKLPNDGYGSPAPDWLDETAAVLNENDFITKNRREAFRKLDEDFNSIFEIVSKAHPVPSKMSQDEINKRVREIRAEMAKSGSGTKAVKLNINNEDYSKKIDKFYGTIRVFIDFLDKYTSKDAVYESIAKGLSEGNDFESWLNDYGAIYGLPSSMEKLNKLWMKFAKKQFKHQ